MIYHRINDEWKHFHFDYKTKIKRQFSFDLLSTNEILNYF